MAEPRIYQGDGWEIHCGRWEDSPLNEVDVIIGDPGFDKATHEGHAVASRPGTFANGEPSRAAVAFDPVNPFEVVPSLLDLSRRWVILFCAFEQLGDYRKAAGGMRRAGGRYVRGGAWVKTNPAPQISGDRPGQFGEGIAIMHPGGGKMRWNGGGKSAIWRGPTAEERHHQTPKPLWLMRSLVEAFSDPGELVWDPYCGSGTTGVACMRLGRRFLGHEMQPHYAEVAAERLRAEERGLTLQAARAGQTSIFDLVGSK